MRADVFDRAERWMPFFKAKSATLRVHSNQKTREATARRSPAIRKRGLATAVQAAWATGASMMGCQFHGMSSSQRDAGQSLATLAMTSAI